MLPSDIIYKILNHCDTNTLRLSSTLCKWIYHSIELRQLLTFRIHCTGLNTTNYSIYELIHLCCMRRENRDVILCSDHTLFLNNCDEIFDSGTFKVRNTTINESIIPVKIDIFTDIPEIIQITPNCQFLLSKNGNIYSHDVHEKYYPFCSNYPLNTNYPVLIHGSQDVVDISMGTSHLLALNKHGQVYGYGSNLHGQLGVGRDISLVPLLNDDYKPIIIPNLNNIIQIVASDDTSFAIDNHGRVYGFGFNYNRELTIQNINDACIRSPTLIPGLINITQISSYESFTLALTSNGVVYGFGCYSYSLINRLIFEVTKLNITDNIVEIACGYIESLLLTSRNDIYVIMNDSINDVKFRILTQMPNIRSITCNFANYILITDDGYIYAFGDNDNGELGLNDKKSRIDPCRIENFNI